MQKEQSSGSSEYDQLSPEIREEAENLQQENPKIAEMGKKFARNIVNALISILNKWKAEAEKEFGRTLTLEEYYDFLEQMLDDINYSEFESMLTEGSKKKMVMFNSGLASVKGILQFMDGWEDEFVRNGHTVILTAMGTYQPRIKQILEQRMGIVNYLYGYICWRLGLNPQEYET